MISEIEYDFHCDHCVVLPMKSNFADIVFIGFVASFSYREREKNLFTNFSSTINYPF